VVREEDAVELDHLVLEVDDPRESIGFYRSVLGLASVREAEFLAGEAPFPSVRVRAGTLVDLFPPRMWRGRNKANPNHFCLSLPRAELGTLRRRLRARGVPVEQESRHNFGARGYASSVYFRDPDGVMIEARSYPVPHSRGRRGR
jgi:catechol 2,3-dioxygenase-like lactoylglutathione lyase family enzyme